MDSTQQKMKSSERQKRTADDLAEPNHNVKRSKIVFQTRCNPKIIFRLIHSLKGHGEFRRVLSDLALDCLLHLRLTRLHRELCADLSRKIEVGKSAVVVHGIEIPLSYASVTKIMGLQCSGTCDQLNVEVTKEEQLRVCSKYNLDGSARISQYSLLSYFEDNPTFDMEFRAKLLLFVIGTLIRPTTNVHIHFKEYIPVLNDMDTLTEFNWAKFLLDGLLDAVTVFQARGAKSLGGCLLYLQMLYLHCVSPIPWTRYDACLLATPILTYWTDDRVNVVIKLMREQGGIHSTRVQVSTSGIPAADATPDASVLPQLLVHEVFISRMKRRICDNEIGLQHMLEGFRHFISQLAAKVEGLQERCCSSKLQ